MTDTQQHAPYDVIVCGAGHAGVEAALAASRMGARTLLVTGNMDTVSQMSCNPAIGGQAKGQMVREIDALGGEMALNTDATAIQFRLLNESKGPAVQSPRAQCDKKAYQFRMKHRLELQANLSLFQAQVTDLICEGGRVIGCKTNLDVEFRGRTVILTTGTFLRGLMHIGDNRSEGGRLGDFCATQLSLSLEKHGIELKRFKTGTPPRISGRSIDYKILTEQKGDDSPTLFGYYDTRDGDDLFHVEQTNQEYVGWKAGSVQCSCWITYTNGQTERIIRENLHRSALYGGVIKGIGPRYCPSIEDKIVRFAGKDRHILFLEPEGRYTDEYYINGLSTSLPFDVQVEMVHSIPGLENARIIRPAYAVEYDYAPPTQLKRSLESSIIENLFFAGQINGTSGYEEAAVQGLVAGVNAVQKGRGGEPLVIQRHEGYCGVLIDDLVTKGTDEPYRLFTSRAEHRLLFNHGSAELRLLQHSERYGLVSSTRLQRIKEKKKCIQQLIDWAETTRSCGVTWADRIRKGEGMDMSRSGCSPNKEIVEEARYRIVYKGYIEREMRQIEKYADNAKIKLLEDMDYSSIKGLRIESAQKLARLKPATLADAAGISGVSPADLAILLVAVRVENQRRRGSVPRKDD